MVTALLALLSRALRYGERTGHPPAGATLHGVAVGPTGGAAPVDGCPPRIEVDHHPSARQAVRSLAQLDVADHGYQPPLQIINRDIALRSLVTLGHGYPARGVEPIDVGAARTGVGHGHPLRGQGHPGLRHP